MKNSFFLKSTDEKSIALRVKQLEIGNVGFYSVGLYPASLAYNCAMLSEESRLLLAPREGRELLGAFSSESLQDMEDIYIRRMKNMATHLVDGSLCVNTLSYLLLNCELVVLSANSNYIEDDLKEACRLRDELNREEVVIACLVGSFCHDELTSRSYLLCQEQPNLAFFSGFHRHGALRNPCDSFTANFCHPEAITALFGSRLLDKLSPNIQVTPGIHNIEGQYIKAAKNISSIFAGFAHTYHKDNPGLLPTLLTLLLDQCLDQAAKVSMKRIDRKALYEQQLFPITELGYGVQLIEAAILRDGGMATVRDHTFSQLTAMVADVKGSMMQPQTGKPTRNFQVGQILATKMLALNRCPSGLEELIDWCQSLGLRRGGLEGITSLQYWPMILESYSIQLEDASMINLLYISIFGTNEARKIAYEVLSNSRELTTYCKESVKPIEGEKFTKLLDRLRDKNAEQIIVKSIASNFIDNNEIANYLDDYTAIQEKPSYSTQLIRLIQDL
ncbi:hypothetical protein [Prochlorococcus marinus]|uniref:Uncharacterized protein n=1 Tax=Prochlorococcus marinus (strain MIT 9211) TaxID=93059 RepID=A9BA17_PROM4|nr:hypothetical protein [Prochlorococcus marinus]ABX08679.1 conserved hypothetical protein [Prochlorococcus marinus str. MIT 9211]